MVLVKTQRMFPFVQRVALVGLLLGLPGWVNGQPDQNIGNTILHTESLPEPSTPGATTSQENVPATTCFRSLTVKPPQLKACETALNHVVDPAMLARVHSALAWQHSKLDRFQDAETAINRALGIAPEDPIVQANLGNLRLQLRNYNEAVAAYNTSLLNRPSLQHEAAVYLNRSLALRGLGRYEEAKLDYEAFRQLAGYGITIPAEAAENAADSWQETLGENPLSTPAQPR